MNLSMDLNKDKESFMDYLKYQKHYSENTIENYERTLNEFIGFLNKESIDAVFKGEISFNERLFNVFK